MGKNKRWVMVLHQMQEQVLIKNGLPAGTTYTWATSPATSTTTPGDKQGVVTVTYPDGSKRYSECNDKCSSAK